MDFENYLIAITEKRNRDQFSKKELADIRGLHDESLLHYLAVENYAEAVSWLAQKGVDVNSVNRFGNTALMDAATLDLIDMVGLLLHLGADPNYQNEEGDTALHKAFESKASQRVCDILIEKGANTNLKNNLGETPMQCSSFC